MTTLGKPPSTTPPERPVPRPRVLLWTLLAAALLAGVVAAAEALRHPLPEGFDPDIGLAEDTSDPRLPIRCEDTIPREGQRRAGGDGDTGQVRGVTPLVTSSQLYDCPEVYDGVTVRYVGEVVGAVLERDGGAWVQLNDDIYGGGPDGLGPLPAHRDYRGGNAGIGVFIPPGLAERISWVGGPDAQGDRLEITGTFQRVDPVSAEVAIIRADVGRITVAGGPFTEPPLPERRVIGLVIAAIALALTVLERLLARRR